MDVRGRRSGTVVHARQGQTVEITLTNGSPMAHSVDFHAARVAPDKEFVDVQPGKSFTFSFKAGDPGVFMYHCGTKPVLAHIANGMFGAIVVDPADTSLMPPAHHSFVLVSNEWYLNGPGLKQPAGLDLVKAHEMKPDWVTWNGGSGIFDVEIDKPGLYPFVSHSFASVDMGQVGVLNVGGAEGTMSHRRRTAAPTGAARTPCPGLRRGRGW
ncbi:MAG TPA: multicopper oxidase domain-containing protein [Gaiellaceae bacterium]|nr:multicopper oxidase domain-containing protein [Gaiellaceae bacterium]